MTCEGPRGKGGKPLGARAIIPVRDSQDWVVSCYRSLAGWVPCGKPPGAFQERSSGKAKTHVVHFSTFHLTRWIPWGYPTPRGIHQGILWGIPRGFPGDLLGDPPVDYQYCGWPRVW